MATESGSVSEIIRRAVTPDARLEQWANSMGTDVELAWRTCPNALWLTLLLRGLGVPSRELTTTLVGIADGAEFDQHVQTLRSDKQVRARIQQLSTDPAASDTLRQSFVPSWMSAEDGNRMNGRALAALREKFPLDRLLASPPQDGNHE